jgi:hypothetical protein
MLSHDEPMGFPCGQSWFPPGTSSADSSRATKRCRLNAIANGARCDVRVPKGVWGECLLDAFRQAAGRIVNPAALRIAGAGLHRSRGCLLDCFCRRCGGITFAPCNGAALVVVRQVNSAPGCAFLAAIRQRISLCSVLAGHTGRNANSNIGVPECNRAPTLRPDRHSSRECRRRIFIAPVVRRLLAIRGNTRRIARCRNSVRATLRPRRSAH